MPSNRIAVALIVISALPLGASLYSVFLSGSTVQIFPIQKGKGATPAVTVNPDMNPLRLLIDMDFSTGLFNSGNNSIGYEISAHEKGGIQLWRHDGYIMDKGDNSASTSSQHQSVQTFDIRKTVDLEFKYHINIDKLSAMTFTAQLELKRNVTRHSWLITVSGLFLLITGIFIVASNKKKQG